MPGLTPMRRSPNRADVDRAAQHLGLFLIVIAFIMLTVAVVTYAAIR